MHERLLYLRTKELKLSQEEFGNHIGVTRAAVSRYESGDRQLSEPILLSICRAFRVNYYWLTEGEGEIFTGVPDCLLDELVEEYNLDKRDRQILECYLNLPEEHRKVIKEVLMNMFGK